MGKKQAEMTAGHIKFIQAQRLFFVGTAASNGRVSVSPKGMDTLRIKGPTRVCWLNLTGSGNETAAHLLENSRMTLMFCAYEGDPMILRLYGQAKLIHPRDPQWEALLSGFPPLPGARQIIEMDIDLLQTSCGFGVPLFDFVKERELLNQWAEQKGEQKISQYWEEKNPLSLDGRPTGILPREISEERK